MVGMVFVSHSNKIAEGTKDLALQMAPDAHIATAGGTDDNEIGTSMLKILNAIKEVESKDGVIILVDLGSAIMSSEMAIEMCESDTTIKIVDGPLVEGGIVGALEASLGSDIDLVENAIVEVKTSSKF